mmetsp:Transcript_2606/g.4770  ORF Transcript_2606/g.4770 Transcript_2606/m.4770 type:complete len:423 (-) Transcript_2606:119-1387(-)
MACGNCLLVLATAVLKLPVCQCMHFFQDLHIKPPQIDTSGDVHRSSGVYEFVGDYQSDAESLKRDRLLQQTIKKYWTVGNATIRDRTPEGFKQRHQCQEEPLLTATFKKLDATTGGVLKFPGFRKSFDEAPTIRIANYSHQSLIKLSVKSGRAYLDVGSVYEFLEQRQARGEAFLMQVEALLEEVDLPDMDIPLSVLDTSPVPPQQMGILRSEGRLGEDLLMLPRSVLQLAGIDKGSHHCLDKQESQAVFRGATTGPHSDRPHMQNPRYFAANLSKRRPDILDAGFSNVIQGWDDAQLKAEGFVKGFLSYGAQQCYSAVLVIDGNSVPDRLPEQLGWGLPVVFMRHYHVDEFWYPELTPNRTVQASSENLEATLDELMNDEKRRVSIGSHGREYVEKRLTVDRLKCYLHQLLSEYGRRFSAK